MREVCGMNTQTISAAQETGAVTGAQRCWQAFRESGRIADYLAYCTARGSTEEIQHDSDRQGACHP